MSDQSDTVACRRCGALNEPSFGQCVRCNLPLSGAAASEPPVVREARGGRGEELLLGRWDANQLPAAKALVALNVLVFAAHLLSAFRISPNIGTLLSGGPGSEAFRFGAMIVEASAAFLPLDPFPVRAEPWRLLSACYVHFGAIHIGMNMLGLIWLARIAEPAIGSVRFILAYTLAGIAGFGANVGYYLLFHGPGPLTAGASGAVFGLMGVILGVLWRRRDPRWKTWLIQGVMYSLLITFAMPRINHGAHLGGLFMGILVGAAFGPGSPKPSTRWQRWLAVACIVGAFASIVAAEASPYHTRLMALMQQGH